MTKPSEDYYELACTLQTPITKAEEPLPKDYKPNPSPVPKPQLMTTIHEEAENQENLRRVNTTDKSEQSLSLFTKNDIILKEDKNSQKCQNGNTKNQQIVQVEIHH